MRRTAEQAKQDKKNKADWQKLLSKWDITDGPKIKAKSSYNIELKRGGSMKDIYKSLDTSIADTFKPEHKVYTGENMIGVAVLHKSCLQPVFNKEDIIDISRMRR